MTAIEITRFSKRFIGRSWLVIVASLFMIACSTKRHQTQPILGVDSIQVQAKKEVRLPPIHYIKITKDIKIKDYFTFMDSISSSRDTIKNPKLNELAIVHANPWIIDSLRNTDYYILKKKGIFSYDQTRISILHKGDSLIIPDSSLVSNISKKLKLNVIDLNIPEYTLRIIQRPDTILVCKVRVGRNAEKYLELAGHNVDLKTHIGEGEIIRVERNPLYIDPDTGKRYDSTKRDDGRYTKMPMIPWIEPSINGKRYGDLIHPTTNINTLGKAYSHGCIGTSEADAWVIYYNSPVGTKVVFRYNLTTLDKHGDTIHLRDIYSVSSKSAK